MQLHTAFPVIVEMPLLDLGRSLPVGRLDLPE
jgi:hypothetical protein